MPRRQQLARLMALNYVFYGTVFERADYDRVGGMRNLRLSEDWDLWVRMAAAGTRFSLARRPTMLYRRHPGNITGADTIVDEERARLIHTLRREHPAWLTPTQWERALRHGRAIGAGRRGLAQLRRGSLHGVERVTELRPTSTLQLLRQGGYFTMRKIRRRPAPHLQAGRPEPSATLANTQPLEHEDDPQR